jgi:hypothetical protein
MAEHGSKCRNKIKLLKSEYYKVVKHGSKKNKYVYHELMDKVLGGIQQEIAEMVHDGSDTEVVEEFDNDTSVGSMENFIYYEYLDKVLGEIQPKLYETEQDMKGKMEDKKAHKKTYSKSRELLYENDDQEIPVIKIDRELPVPKIDRGLPVPKTDRGLPVPKIDRGLTWTKEETITLIQIWSNPDIQVRVVTS